MAQNITLLGASYSDVPGVALPKTGGGTATFFDPSDTTAQAADVAAGKYFLSAAGVLTEGTASGGGGTGGITQDGDGYLVLDDQGGGGGGGSSYTLLYSTEVEVSTTSTSTINIDTVTVSRADPNLTILYIQIRDKAGKRNGYFYSTNTYWTSPVGGSQSNDYRKCDVLMTNSSGKVVSVSTSQYGVFAGTPTYSSDVMTLPIRARYHSSYSGTIDGTYVVEVYNLEWPGNISPFT